MAENYSEDISNEIIFGETNINDVLVMLQNNEEKYQHLEDYDGVSFSDIANSILIREEE